MALKPTSEGARVYKAVPQLARIREQVLLGDVWKQPELSYRDREGRTTRRQVECHGLYTRGRDWYVVGWCRLRADRRLFRLDRIATVSVLPEPVAERDLDEILGWVPVPAERPSLLPDD